MVRKSIKRPRHNSRKKRKFRTYREQEEQAYQEDMKRTPDAVVETGYMEDIKNLGYMEDITDLGPETQEGSQPAG